MSVGGGTNGNELPCTWAIVKPLLLWHTTFFLVLYIMYDLVTAVALHRGSIVNHTSIELDYFYFTVTYGINIGR